MGNLADSASIIIFTPVVQRLLPCIESCIGRNVSVNMKVYTGIGFAILAQLVAALIEYARKASEVLPIESMCAPLVPNSKEHVHMSNMSAFWMVIPYMIIGVGEILVNPVLQFVAYEGAPESMRSMLQAFNLFCLGGMPNAVSSAIGMATISLTPNNLNNGDLSVVYYIQAGFGLVGCGCYYVVSRNRVGVGKPTKNGFRDPDSTTDESESGSDDQAVE